MRTCKLFSILVALLVGTASTDRALAGGGPTPGMMFAARNAGLTGAFSTTGGQYVAAWADYNADGRLDILYTGTDSLDHVQTKLYRQLPDGTFASTATNLPAVTSGVLRWAEINHDQYPDLFLAGDTGSLNYIAHIYRNNGGDGTFTELNTVLPTLAQRGAAWADFDGDGDPDLLVSGSSTDVFRNDNGTFIAINGPFLQEAGAVDWGDYNGDGKPDIIIASDGAFSSNLHIYRNDGLGSFVDSGFSLGSVPALISATVLWGDFNGDGHLDIFYRGDEPGILIKRGYLLLNDGAQHFSFANADLSNFEGWIDFDGDGKFDFYSPNGLHINEYPAQADYNTSISVPCQGNGASLVWGDLDGDGDYDAFCSSTDFFGPKVELYTFTPSIFGSVVTGEVPTGVENVQLMDSVLGTVQTNQDGMFAFANVQRNLNYAVTPSKPGYLFEPISIVGFHRAITALAFEAFPSFSLSGTIKIGNVGQADVVVDGGVLGVRVTDSTGRYDFGQVKADTQYTITPAYLDYSFTPPSYTVQLAAASIRDFAADGCPSDQTKLTPGLCGCGVVDNNLDSDGDAEPNCIDSDDDNDGLHDEYETSTGSDPLDSGSGVGPLGTRLCADWNSYLGGMYNFLEHVNQYHGSLHLQTTLYSIEHNVGAGVRFALPMGGQVDVPVHALTGWQLSSYGQVCTEVLNTENRKRADDLFDGRMVYYRPGTQVGDPYVFALSMPLDTGKSGKQWLTINTYQPSLDPLEREDYVANWLQIRNLSDKRASGSLRFFDLSGIETDIVQVKLRAHERLDYSGHALGQNQVRAVLWEPQNSELKFQFRNIRYYYDNPVLADSFRAAVAVEGAKGSGRLLSALVDTGNSSAILELTNALPSKQTIEVRFYDEPGTELRSFSLKLRANASEHLIADGIYQGKKGFVTVKGTSPESVFGQVLLYSRTTTGSVRYIYSEPLREALGSQLTGSYNSFLSQGCVLTLANPTETGQEFVVNLRSSDGQEVGSDSTETIAAHATWTSDICADHSPDRYGSVSVTPVNKNTLIGRVVRNSESNNLHLSIPLRGHFPPVF